MASIIRGKAALIINECQLGVIDERYAGFPGLARQVEARGIVPRIAKLADAFRAAGLPVVHTPVIHRTDFIDIAPTTLINALTLKGRKMAEGSEGVGYVEGLEAKPEDIEIIRTSGIIAFNGTSLDAILRRMNVSTVVLTGVSSNLAMPGNMMTASDLGYTVVIPEDCIAAADPDTHEVIVEQQLRMLSRISTAEEVTAAIQTSA